MNAFIVRPFGTKNGVNFDEVQEKLIEPALKKAGVNGFTTAAVIKAGNIRLDMFQLLLTTDLVVADISIHNANVFYELGIRHALRRGRTFLIRYRGDEVPFDLKTDRYFAYDPQDLKTSIEALALGIKATMDTPETDSPVYLMLPDLRPPDTRALLPIPEEFSKELDLAVTTRNSGKLRLLAQECCSFSWAVPAWRIIGTAQFEMNKLEDARETWERILDRNPREKEPNELLATIYQRLGEKQMAYNPSLADEFFAKSEQALNILLNRVDDFEPNYLSELYALKGRNDKSKWIRFWEKEPDILKEKVALESGLLSSAYQFYIKGYHEDLNKFYAPINALGLLKIMLELAVRAPDVWNTCFDSDEAARKNLEKYRNDFEILHIMLGMTMAIQEERINRSGTQDVWLALTKAELSLLTISKPDRVARLYQQALEAGKRAVRDFNVEASLRQLRMYEKLNILPEMVPGIIEVFSKFDSMPEKANKHIILFTGHMIDAPDRKTPRFPGENETMVREKIRSEVLKILVTRLGTEAPTKNQLKNISAIAGGACGGDIIFHEICKSLGISSEVFLALPPDKFVARSVSFAGSDWIDRFYTLHRDPDTTFHVLSESEDLPAWLEKNDSTYSIWERNNLWILNTALSRAGHNLTLLALWDGRKGDGPGGTEHMIRAVAKKGAPSIIIKPK